MRNTPEAVEWDWTYRWPAQLSHLAEWARYAVEAGIVNRLGVKSVLDLCCGAGGLLPYLRTEIEYLGMDLSQKAIAEARRLYPDRTFVNTLHELAGKFDCITTNSLIYLDTDSNRCAKELSAKHLKPNGYLVAVTYKSSITLDADWDAVYSWDIAAEPNHKWTAQAWRLR